MASTADGDGASRPGGDWQDVLWRHLKRRPGRGLLAALAVGVLAGLPVGGATNHGTTTYSSTTVMILDDPLQIAIQGNANELVMLDDLRYKYASLVSTYAMAAPVANDLHVPVSLVLGSVSVQVPSNSLLMNVTGTSSSPAFSSAVSSAMSHEIIEYIKNEDATNAVPPSDQFAASEVSPTSAAVASKPSHTHALALGIVVFVAVAVIVFIGFQLLFATEPTRRRR